MRNLAQISSPSLGPTREPVKIFRKYMLISIVMRLNHVGVFKNSEVTFSSPEELVNYFCVLREGVGHVRISPRDLSIDFRKKPVT